MFKNFWDNLRKLDWPLSLAVLVLFCFGLAAIYSVSLSQQSDDFSNFNIVKCIKKIFILAKEKKEECS